MVVMAGRGESFLFFSFFLLVIFAFELCPNNSYRCVN